ncbi:MAG: hypothetical protein QM811_12455 [Pirellulales bacterium]
MRWFTLVLGVAAVSICTSAFADYRDADTKILGREGNFGRRANVVRYYAAPQGQVVAARPAAVAQPVAAQPAPVVAATVDNGSNRRVMSYEPAAPRANVRTHNRDAWDNADTKILGREGR